MQERIGQRPFADSFRRRDADAKALGYDIAQLLASMLFVVSAERAVPKVCAVICREALIGAVPHLMPLVLSTETLAHLGDKPDLLEQIKEAIGDSSLAASSGSSFSPAEFHEQP